jgi:hypothetical protein
MLILERKELINLNWAYRHWFLTISCNPTTNVIFNCNLMLTSAWLIKHAFHLAKQPEKSLGICFHQIICIGGNISRIVEKRGVTAIRACSSRYPKPQYGASTVTNLYAVITGSHLFCKWISWLKHSLFPHGFKKHTNQRVHHNCFARYLIVIAKRKCYTLSHKIVSMSNAKVLRK